MRRIILISLFLGLAVLPSLAGAADITARVFETGIDNTPVPVSDIKVDVLAGKGFKKLLSASTSGSDGTCFLGGVPFGKDLLVRLTKQGYVPQYVIRSFSEDDLKGEVALWTGSESNVTRVFQNLGETFRTNKAHAYVDISDWLTGEGIEGIHLTASTGKAFDLGGGEYLISNAEGICLKIGIQKPGYAFDIDSVTIPLFPGAFTQYDVKIQSEGAIFRSIPAQQVASASITGFIKRLSDAAPVEGLSVAFTFIRGGPKGTTARPPVQTDAAGFYSQSGFLVGDRIRVTPIGEGFKFKPSRKNARVKAAGGAVADFKAAPPEVPPPPPPPPPPPAPPPQVVTITTPLTGGEEVPPVATAGTATGILNVDLNTGTITGSLPFMGLSSGSTVAHIHQGPVGVEGGFIVSLLPSFEGGIGGPSGTFFIPPNTVLTPAQLDLLRTNQLYWNIHSVNFPDGELRGQILFPGGS
jgi:hypothetical protein